MSDATEVKPDRNPGLRIYTLDELVEGARMHGQLLRQAGRSLVAVKGDDPDELEQQELLEAVAVRASGAAVWLMEVGKHVIGWEGSPVERDFLHFLIDSGATMRLHLLTLAVYGALTDPKGEQKAGLVDIEFKPWWLCAHQAEDVGNELACWAERHGKGADTT